jgi:hypothetical protein
VLTIFLPLSGDYPWAYDITGGLLFLIHMGFRPDEWIIAAAGMESGLIFILLLPMFIQIVLTCALSLKESRCSQLDSLNKKKISQLYTYLAIMDSINNYFIYYPLIAGLSRYFGNAYDAGNIAEGFLTFFWLVFVTIFFTWN